jgi:hypothetical protein
MGTFHGLCGSGGVSGTGDQLVAGGYGDGQGRLKAGTRGGNVVRGRSAMDGGVRVQAISTA